MNKLVAAVDVEFTLLNNRIQALENKLSATSTPSVVDQTAPSTGTTKDVVLVGEEVLEAEEALQTVDDSVPIASEDA